MNVVNLYYSFAIVSNNCQHFGRIYHSNIDNLYFVRKIPIIFISISRVVYTEKLKNLRKVRGLSYLDPISTNIECILKKNERS